MPAVNIENWSSYLAGTPHPNCDWRRPKWWQSTTNLKMRKKRRQKRKRKMFRFILDIPTGIWFSTWWLGSGRVSANSMILIATFSSNLVILVRSMLSFWEAKPSREKINKPINLSKWLLLFSKNWEWATASTNYNIRNLWAHKPC